MIKLDNPHVEELEAARRADDKKAEEAAYVKWSNYTQEQLRALDKAIEEVIEPAEALDAEAELFSQGFSSMSYNKLYRLSIELYKKAHELMLYSRSIKKNIREAKK